MLRTNYLPKVAIFQDFETKRWFATQEVGGLIGRKNFVQLESGEYAFDLFDRRTYFKTLDELLEALYTYAYKKHLEVIKDQLTYNTVKVKL